MDKIIISNLQVPVHIGTMPNEQDQPTRLRLDLELSCHLEQAGRSDALSDTLDYFTLEEELYRTASGIRCQLLEYLAERLAELLLSKKEILSCQIKITKPGVMRYSDPVSIIINRSK